MISQDEAIALAREVGAGNNAYNEACFLPQELTALCNAVRKQTLLEAADVCIGSEFPREELRRMAVENERVDDESSGNREDVAYNTAIQHVLYAIESLPLIGEKNDET